MPFEGLSEVEAEERLRKYGLNKIEEKKQSLIGKIVHWFISPISLMLLAAAALSFISRKTLDFSFIMVLIVLNFSITFWQERKADNAIQKLAEQLSMKLKVFREGKWKEIDSSFIVPGDILQLMGGNIIPADLKILEAKNLAINEASLTGESLPKEKAEGDIAYSGSFIVTGQAKAVVEATGRNTYFGKIIFSIDRSSKESLLEKDILSISKSLSFLSLIAVVILTAVFVWAKLPLAETLTLDLSLIIAGIPISLPTVMTLIISLGVLELAKKDVVVRRLSSLEDLANVNLLFTDKTGTLTKNKITIQGIISYISSPENVVHYALLAAIQEDRDPINKAIIKKAEELKIDLGDYKIIDFVPPDSVRKRNFIQVMTGGKDIAVSVGAPQVIASFCDLDPAGRERFENDVRKAADEGYRSLAVAVNANGLSESKMTLAGILLLSDTLRKDAKDIISFLQKNGVEVRMLTGDHRAIGERMGQELGLKREFVFSEILPDDKYRLVEEGKKHHVVAVTGDGINDLPAVKTANVGIAVNNAVDALKSSADIVLLSSGISVIKDAIIEARKVFHRLYSYSVYRISESIRLIVTIAVLGLIYHDYPLTPVQLFLLAFLNDVPIISLAFNRVKASSEPAKINAKARIIASSLYGLVGVANSLLLFFILTKWFHMSLSAIQPIFFLKLAISGHMLIYVAHTEERWYKFLPSKHVIFATLGTQILATFIAVSGIFMAKTSIGWAIFVWIWAIFWMQITELTKEMRQKKLKGDTVPVPVEAASGSGISGVSLIEMKEQYELQKKVLEETGILKTLSNGKKGIEAIDGNEYPFPEYQEILGRVNKNKGVIKVKSKEGFNNLLIVPFGASLDEMIKKYGEAILKHYKEGKLFATKVFSIDLDQSLDLNEGEPVWVWGGYKNADAEGKLIYYPDKFSAHCLGKTKKEILESEKEGFHILLIEDMPNIPKEGKGKIIEGRKQLETHGTPVEYLKSIKEEITYKSEQGMTPEDQIIYAIQYLEKTNQVIDDYQGHGAASYQLGAYFPASDRIACAFWNRFSYRAHIDRGVSSDRDPLGGVRTAVRI